MPNPGPGKKRAKKRAVKKTTVASRQRLSIGGSPSVRSVGVVQAKLAPAPFENEPPPPEQSQSVKGSLPDPAPSPESPREVAVTIHRDGPARDDELERKPFARVLASSMRELRARGDGRMAEAHERPGDASMLHVYGPWGSGKTSVLNFLRDILAAGEGQRGTQGAEKWVVVDFNAWRHQHAGPPWWALITAVQRQGRKQVWTVSRRRYARLLLLWAWWRFRTSLAPNLLSLAVLLWVISLAAGWLVKPASAGSGASVLAAVKNALEIMAILLGSFGLLVGGIRALMMGSSCAAQRFVDLSHDAMRPIVCCYARLARAIGQPLAILVDDLDRCDPGYVIELLRGIQTLFHEENVTYVVAADREWLRASYESQYDEFDGKIGEPGRPLGYLFLDKLFQVSASVPALDRPARKRYLDLLLGSTGDGGPASYKEAIERARKQAGDEIGDEYRHDQLLNKIKDAQTPALKQAYREIAAERVVSARARTYTEHVLEPYADLLEPNPRAMKRLVNSYGIQKAVSLLSGQDIPLEPLVLWTILGMRWPLLALRLERHPEEVDRLIGPEGGPSDGVKKEFGDLLENPDLLRILRQGLSTRNLKTILGR